MTEHYSHVALAEKHAAVAHLVRLVPTPCRGDAQRSGDGGGDGPTAQTKSGAGSRRNPAS